jgi:hypothetical protein
MHVNDCLIIRRNIDVPTCVALACILHYTMCVHSGDFPTWEYMHRYMHDMHCLKHTENARCHMHGVCFP